jgi:UPF0271 protein
MKSKTLKECVLEQINTLNSICISQKAHLDYIKPHGALYNDMMENLDIFETICQTLSINHKNIALMIQALPSPQQFIIIARKYNISLLFEAFADRAYQKNGLLVPRSQKNSVYHQQSEVIEQISQLIKYQQLTSIDNQILRLNVDTLCVHGDNNSALELISALRKLINESV